MTWRGVRSVTKREGERERTDLGAVLREEVLVHPRATDTHDTLGAQTAHHPPPNIRH